MPGTEGVQSFDCHTWRKKWPVEQQRRTEQGRQVPTLIWVMCSLLEVFVSQSLCPRVARSLQTPEIRRRAAGYGCMYGNSSG